MKLPHSIRLLTWLLLTFALLGAVTLWGSTRYTFSAEAPFITPVHSQTSEEEDIRLAIEQAMIQEMPHALALLLYDTRVDQIEVSSNGEWATGWLIPLDPETGQVVPIEPGLALVKKTAEGWKAFIPSDPLWVLVIQQIPDDLIPADEKELWRSQAEFQATAVTTPLRGYYLPFGGGETMALTQSVGHDRYTPSGTAHYAFDFAKPGYPSGMYNVYAAKGGIVKRAVWTYENGNESFSNYMVLEDKSTYPTTYQLYMHFAKDSIPPALRIIGTPVQRGMVIGIADDTGISSGNHLHFMVHTNATSYWGTSVDIQFEDVTINGGRPRITSDLPYCKSTDVCDTTQTTYVSGNFLNPDHIAPDGSITSPIQGSLIESSVLPLQGWAKDENSGIASVQIIAQYNGDWHPVGNPFFSETFTYNWDMCADGVPDGPLSVALTIMDKAQNKAEGLPGLIHYSKNYECPQEPPICTPGENQVAIHADPDFHGKCTILNVGSYLSAAQLGEVGNDNVDSIQIGSNVQATLYYEINLEKRGETFFFSDSSLSDNLIGRNKASSILVQTRTTLPTPPILIWPENAANIEKDASLSLSWENSAGASEYQLEITQNTTQIMLTPWVKELVWHIGGLAPGIYDWKVKGRNINGESSWSAVRSLNIVEALLDESSQLQAFSLPYFDNMDQTSGNWTAVNWTPSTEANHTEGGSTGWEYDVGSTNGYDNGFPNSGMLTSPPIQIPDSSEPFLRFYYRYETEDERAHWDQRWVQVSSDGGPFLNVLQLSNDPMGYWLRSPAINLLPYSGKTIRVRFYFATRDELDNQYMGWHIDDVSITFDPPPACIDEDNTIPQARLIEDGQTLDGMICPGGDVDTYKFQGIAGDQISIRTQAQVIGSPLDTAITLIDIDGSSPLASNDDIQQYERRDSLIYYRLTRTGLYYFQVRAWDHPNAGGTNEIYKVSFHKDKDDPDATFLVPSDGSAVQSGIIYLEVAARDVKSGVAMARFYWHPSDWLASNWIFLGEDWDPGDGWKLPFDTSSINDRNGIAFYSVVSDWAGNWVGTGAWNLHQPMLYLPIIRK